MHKLLVRTFALIMVMATTMAILGCKKDKADDDDQLRDADGNVYTSVVIGSQEWMVPNLKTTRYRNGDPVPHVNLGNEWKALSTGAYCNYGNNPAHAETYGRLYNWFAVNDLRFLCPKGWHVPTKTEWDTLLNYLGGMSQAGSKLREADTLHWASPNYKATDEFGFTALPGGTRNYSTAEYLAMGTQGYWWSNTVHIQDSTRVYRYWTTNQMSAVNSDPANKRFGNSLRCLRD